MGSDRPIFSSISEIASHAEGYTIEALASYARTISEGIIKPIPEIVERHSIKAIESSWRERQTFISSWMKVDITRLSWWKSWLGYVEARNAWAHGLGKLTKRQMKSQEVVANLTAAGFIMQSGKVLVRAEDVRSAATTAVNLVDWIDEQVQQP
ncbi:hypothetical protein QEN42_02165 [Gordonia alkanivorans]|uniref:hypothetical protein n=1 Tax=Gordonia alkanivorans TaxID=84096 RepID=UPI00244ADC74|nr:hypothetical protein [Gordonia alkanivorans]MDH3048679.1 hypothetical protein [Gordonia alkanivorans]